MESCSLGGGGETGVQTPLLTSPLVETVGWTDARISALILIVALTLCSCAEGLVTQRGRESGERPDPSLLHKRR